MKWFCGSIAEAVTLAKTKKKLFLVYIEGTDDLSKAMSDTYNDPAISRKLVTENIIALKLTANSVPFNQFCAIYPVLIIPSSYFIGLNGVVIEVVTGSLAPSEFAIKVDKIKDLYEKSLPTAQETPLSQPESSGEKLPNPNLPSTSQASDEVEIQPALEERVERAKSLLEAKKQIQENEEKEKEKNDELARRSTGKALQKAQQEQKDNELKEWAKNRAKEKEEERIAREKVKALIEQDRLERKARYEQTMKKNAEEAEKERQAKIREEQERAARVAASNCNEARIQFRLPDGSSTNHVFSADSSLDEAKRFVQNEIRPPFSNFSLCTTFPRRHFTQSNYSESLRDLQLAPSAVILILPGQSVSTISGSGGSFWSMIFWTLLSPFVYSWRTLTSIYSGIFGSRNQPSQPSTDSPKNQNEQNSSRPTGGVRRRDGSFVRQEGNIYRLNNQSDDGENNTWNGNSTQQM